MSLETLLQAVKAYKSDVNEALLTRAYYFAEEKHKSQKRASGEAYFSHPLEVAHILAQSRLDEITLSVALLHDTLEDTETTREELDKNFGEEVGELVEGLTKIRKLELFSQKAIQAENLRKFLVAMSKDIRVLLIKLADRLHNMRTLDAITKEEKRQRIAQETMDIYVPLADRMGIIDMQEELEELSFKYLNQEAHGALTRRLAYLFEHNKDLVSTVTENLDKIFAQYSIDAQVMSRKKTPYSVFRKMRSKSLSFEQLSDIFGFRIVVSTIEDCYRVLGIVHTNWSMVPGRFKDYISTPKQNGYRSIHTTIFGPSRQRLELQIRTQEMDNLAEYGIAAHPIYKEKGGAFSHKLAQEMEAFSWIRQILHLLSEGETPEEFLEHTKLELFQDQVFCFTPKGRLIALPRGANSIDFAYAVHTQIGHSCVRAKINGRNMPLIKELDNGDEVEIICSSVKTPPSAWESMARTARARAAIRRATRAAVYEQYCSIGSDILRRTFENRGKNFDKSMLSSIVSKFARKNEDDILVAVGRSELESMDVFRALYPSERVRRFSKEGKFSADTKIQKTLKEAGETQEYSEMKASEEEVENVMNLLSMQSALPIKGVAGHNILKFCSSGAAPGDSIVGIMQEDSSIVIYPIYSLSLEQYTHQPEKWIDVRWDIDKDSTMRFPICVRAFLINKPGTLADFARIVAENDANIANIVLQQGTLDFIEVIVTLEVCDVKHLDQILEQIRATDTVSSVERFYGELKGKE